MTDQQAISAYQGGDVEGFNVIYRKYKDRLYWFIYKYLKDEELTKDILQDTFLRVVRFANGYKPNQKFTTWLFTIAKNLSLSEIQRQHAEKRDAIELSKDAEHEDFRPLQIKDPKPNPHQSLESKATVSNILDRVDSVKKPYRESLQMVAGGFEYGEISQALGIKMNTVKSRIYRGRQCLN